MKSSRVKKELTNKKVITSVSDYLTVLKNEVQEAYSGSERFFRELSKTEYIEKDYSSIYRAPRSENKKMKKG